jgi:hypothetical protein
MMPYPSNDKQTVREVAYHLWEQEGKPECRSLIHWEIAEAMCSSAQQMEPLLDEEEAVVDGNPRADFPALMTKDTSGG